MAEVISGNITLESASIDKAVAAVEKLNAKLGQTLKTARAVNAELKGIRMRGGKSSVAESSVARGGGVAGASLTRGNINNFTNAFNVALTRSIAIRDNFRMMSIMARGIRNEFRAMLTSIESRNRIDRTNPPRPPMGGGGNIGGGGGGGGRPPRTPRTPTDGNVGELRFQRAPRTLAGYRNFMMIGGMARDARQSYARSGMSNMDIERNMNRALRVRGGFISYNPNRLAELRNSAREMEVSAGLRNATDRAMLSAIRRDLDARNLGDVSKARALYSLGLPEHRDSLVRHYQQARTNNQQRLEGREREGANRRMRSERMTRYHGEREIGHLRDTFVSHGMGFRPSLLSGIGELGRRGIFNIMSRRAGAGLDPNDPQFDYMRAGNLSRMMGRMNVVGGIASVAGGAALALGKLSLMIAKFALQVHIAGTMVAAAIAAIGARAGIEGHAQYQGMMNKMMVSHTMFANNTIGQFDRPAQNKYVMGYYDTARDLTSNVAMPGLRTAEEGIRIAHLIGTGEGGGFRDDKEAMDWTRGVMAAAQVNGMSDTEVKTLIYQLQQVASKGYADLLDVKPLLNSAPGIINDIVAFTGMSREEMLQSGKTKALTWDKMREMFVQNRQYYETLASRRDAQDIPRQFAAAKDAFMLNLMTNQKSGKSTPSETNQIMHEIAGSDLVLEVGGMLGSIANEFIHFFIMMFADEGDSSIRGAITNFGHTVVDFLVESSKFAIDMVVGMKQLWANFSGFVVSIVRWFGDNALTKGIVESMFGGEIPSWAKSHSTKNDKYYEVTMQDGRKIEFGGNEGTQRVIDSRAEVLRKEETLRHSNELKKITAAPNAAASIVGKWGATAQRAFAPALAEIKKEADANVLMEKQLHGLKMREENLKDAAAQDVLEEYEKGAGIRYTNASRGGKKVGMTRNGILSDGSERVGFGAYRVKEADRNHVIQASLKSELVDSIIENDKQKAAELARKEANAMKDKLDDLGQSSHVNLQSRPDMPELKKTNTHLQNIEENTGKGKAALDKVTEVLIEFTRNRVINNITRVRPNVVVNFGDITDLAQGGQEWANSIKRVIEAQIGSDNVTTSIGG